MVTASPIGEKPIGPRSSKGERTRARLVAAAKQEFEVSGYLDARISDIAERAGLSHGSFYHYFESKDEVFLEVAEAVEDRFSLRSIVDSGRIDSSPGMALRERVRAANRRFLSDYRDEARIMGVIEQVARYHDEVRAVRSRRQNLYVQHAETSIRRLQRGGRVDPELDPKVVAAALTAMVTRFAELWFVQGALDCPFEDGVDALTALCTNALQLKD